MVKGYVLSEGDRAAVRRVVAKVGDTPLSGAALKSRHRPEADADYSYSGYFKIVDASTTGNGTTTHKIRVVDGATYDPETGSSGPSVCKVNNQVFSVEPAEFTVSASKVYVLKFTAESVESEGSPAKVEVVEVNALPSDDSDYAWYQIGRVIVDDGSMTIQQDHTAGVVQMFWYLLCGEV